MEWKKNHIMAAIAAVCLIAAGVVAYTTLFKSDANQGWKSLEPGVMYWMMCKSCGNTFQIERKEYFAYLQKKDPMMMNVAPMDCPKCEKSTVYQAFECSKCQHYFYPGAAGPTKFEDACPKCGFSQEAENRKAGQ